VRLIRSHDIIFGAMSDMTCILNAIEQGDPQAAEQLLPLVYDELRTLAAQKLAQEKPGQTLDATALVHEAYIRLVDVAKQQHWDGRGHFFSAAAEAMRRILVENARRKKRLKRGGSLRRIELDHLQLTADGPSDELLALDEAIAKLAEREPAKVELVKLRFFAGLTIDEASKVLGISTTTADRHWAYARDMRPYRLNGKSDVQPRRETAGVKHQRQHGEAVGRHERPQGDHVQRAKCPDLHPCI
jgi:RNA polymerase sigma factor (TIGR02999 family)